MKNDIWPPPCVHGNGTNLCPSCQHDYDYDPQSYIEYGDHPEGQKNFKDLLDEIAKWHEEQALYRADVTDLDLPF